MQGITIFMRLVGGQQVAREARNVEGGIDNVSRAAGRLKFAALSAFAALGAGLAAGASTGIRYQAQIEQLEIAFGTLLKSQEKAAEYVDYLEDKGAATPFEVADLATASQTLLGFNFSLAETKRLLDAAGDASSALGRGNQGLQSLALIFGQINAKGRLQGDELLQLAEAGISPDAIRESMGLSKEDFRKAVEGGKVDARTAIDALTRYMEREYEGAMNRQSETLLGQWSTFQDNLRQTLASGSTPATNWLSDTALPEANEFLESLSVEGSEARDALDAAGKELSEIGEALKTAAQDAEPFYENVVKPVAEFSAMLTGELFKNAPAAIEAIGKALGAVGDAAGTLGAGLKDVYEWGQKVGIFRDGGPTVTQLPSTTTTPEPAPSMVPGRRAPSSKPAPKPPIDLNPGGGVLPGMRGRRQSTDVTVNVPVHVDGREIARADARARADERARR